MPVVDAHCHVATAWYEPVEALVFQMDQHGVDQAVLVQMQGQFDNSYQSGCTRRFPGRFASVVLVDPSSGDAPAALRRLAAEGASGLRLNATTRSPGDDPLRIWKEAEQLGLAVSCAGAAADFADPAFATLAESVPGLTIVLEHLGSLNRPDRAEREREDRIATFRLARLPNILMKVTGLGEFCERASPLATPNPFAQPEPPLLEMAVQAFGTDRLMWGSDFPPVSMREGYGNSLDLPRSRIRAIPGVDELAVDRIFGSTAQQVFPVRG